MSLEAKTFVYSLKSPNEGLLTKDRLNIIQKINIKFFLYCGTCLGAHREKKFIEHDHDIDIGVFENDFYKIQNTMNQYKSIFYLERYFQKGKGMNNL